MRPNKQAYLRAIERRKREDDAPRLKSRVPRIESLNITISESGRDLGDLDVSYIRRVVVERAPALFDLPCSDPRCTGGGHDVTRPFLNALRHAQTSFEGSHRCGGTVKETECPLALRFEATATYGETKSV
ncbi:MAG: hypothetical protein VB934_06840 [Polyangiaceae bacterium]